MRSLSIVLVLIISIFFNGCGTGENTQYIETEIAKNFRIDEYYGVNYNVNDVYFIDVFTDTSKIVDNSTGDTFSYNTDLYDEGIITIIMNRIDSLNVNTIVDTFENNLIYNWDNIYNYEIKIQYIGYSGSNRLYNLVMFVDNTYVDSFIINLDYNGYWYIE